MAILTLRRPVLLSGRYFLTMFALTLGFDSTTRAQEPADIDPREQGNYLGATLCQQCHTVPSPLSRNSMDWVLMTEYATWRTMDKHSQAYTVLAGPRGQRMGELLGIEVAKSESCLNCHAMNFPGREGDLFSLKDGVSCDGCHGPSENWLGPHSQRSWRNRLPHEKEELGMIDLRDPVKRTELCMSCHVGNAVEGKVVTHTMYAAGHPPLPSVDISSFIQNMPQHWRDMEDVPWWEEASPEVQEAYDYNPDELSRSKVSVVGGMVSLREAMSLMADRSQVDNVNESMRPRWPELEMEAFGANSTDSLGDLIQKNWPQLAMTHADCAACHHDLKQPSWRQQRGYKLTPGRPLPRSWPFALVELNVAHQADNGETYQDLMRQYSARVTPLMETFDVRPFGVPQAVHQSARQFVSWADEVILPEVLTKAFDRSAVAKLLEQLAQMGQSQILDYEEARQVASTIQAFYANLYPGGSHQGDDRIQEIFRDWNQQLALGRYPYSDEREALILDVLKQIEPNADFSGFGDASPEALADRGTLRDPEALYEELRTIPFLQTLAGIDPEPLRDAFVEAPFRDKLQEINNDGLGVVLENMSEYDPNQFQGQLNELSALLERGE